MSNKKEPVVLLKGGRGGKGNQHYATPTMQAPKYAQPGGKAQEIEGMLELKVIADVGFAFVTLDKNVDFPTFGNPTNPTSAITFNSSITSISCAFPPG